MESYVVLIYRRDADAPGELTGLVERVEDGRRAPFSSVSELWAFLCEPVSAVSGDGRTRS